MTAATRGLLLIERILRDRASIWQQVRDERNLRELVGQTLLCSVVALACYGAVLGVSNGVLQAISSAVKLPILFLVTLAICLPTLYLFNLVFGAHLSLRQALTLVMVAITVMSMLALAFAPISLFFVITAPNYGFYKLLNVAILTLTGLVGLNFLIDGMRSLNRLSAAPATAPPVNGARPVAPPASSGGTPPAAPETPAGAPHQPTGTVPATVAPATVAAAAGAAPQATAVMDRPQPQLAHYPTASPVRPPESSGKMGLLYVWAGLFGLVGTQLAWTLRPFFGSPGEPFEIVRTVEGNFYVDILRTIAGL
jgi:hypothetical protein